MGEIIKEKEKEVYCFKSPDFIDYQTMKSGVEALKGNTSLPRELYILEDARGVDAMLSLEEVEELIHVMRDVAEDFNLIKHAVIHDNPKNTAIALIFEVCINFSAYDLKVFSTQEAAKQWLIG